ncbi:hypothetical protein KC959_02825, partial [Candidatus Saccharibacteria bacterium]|nr:hypothetical protein [Candidatus Saccharibacteria bacterium]
SSCIDATSEEELTAIHDNAGPLLEEDALNIIVADTLFCDKSANTPGKTTPGMPPLLTVAASYNFPDILTHELGHSAGLGHAGELLCDQPEAFQSCEKFPTIDYLSIMGYRDGKNFSNFELASIGLIGDDAILHNPSPGEIVLRDIGQLGEAPQGIVMDTENGQLFVSWEKDYIAGEEIRSLQLRIIDTDDRVLEPYLVSTKGNAYSSSSGQSSNLTMIPGTVVYSDSKIKVAYLGMNQNGEAIVKVEGN